MKKYFLSSMLVMGLMSPVFGADGKITGGAGTCTVDVLGVYDNNATANTIATWALNDYDCGAGQYLVIDDGTITCQPCPAGSYCPGGKYTVENASDGENSCPTGYTQSNAGASANTECYTNCTVANANIAHATAVTGNDYYGTGTDTCVATNCELGYDVDVKIEVIENPLIPIDYNKEPGYIVAINLDGSSNYVLPTDTDTKTEQEVAEAIAKVGLTKNSTWAAGFEEGLVYGRASCQPRSSQFEEVQRYLNILYPDSYEYRLETIRTGLESLVGKPITDYLINSREHEKWNDFFKGWHVVIGMQPDANFSPDSVGETCYCQVDGYKLNDGDRVAVTSAPWEFFISYQTSDDCVSSCAVDCSRHMLYGSDADFRTYRGALLGAFEVELAGGMCKVTETDCPAGQYLAIVGDTMMCAPCPSGSYCPGGTYTIESENKGTNACPSGYPNSDAGAGADTQCYTACTLDAANIAHATKVSGNDYYGAGTDTCYATACAQGYHVDGEIELIEKTPLIPVDYMLDATKYSAKDANGREYNGYDEVGLTENNTWAAVFDYGTVYGRASCQPTASPIEVYYWDNQDALMAGTMSIEEFRKGAVSLASAAKVNMYVELMELYKSFMENMENMTESETAKLIEEFTMVSAKISVSGINAYADYSTDSTGQYCYCQMDGYMPISGEKTKVMSAPWVFLESVGSAAGCADSCASYCAGYMYNDFASRGAMLGALDYVETSTCAANTINIDWNPDNGGAHTQNMCLYDGAITLPTPDPVKPGYVFSGWKLVE